VLADRRPPHVNENEFPCVARREHYRNPPP
jgi:hypothetical protein